MNAFPVVREVWVAFTTQFEGWVNYMYLDVTGLVHCGMGNLLDNQKSPSAEPTPAALSLPWTRPDGTAASPEDIAIAWRAVKAHPDLKIHGGGPYEALTTIRLTNEAIGELIVRKFDGHDAFLGQRFPKFSRWPADAQLATHGMAWAAGPAFKYPNFAAAATSDPPNFNTMAAECALTPLDRYARRNAAQKQCFLNAVNVVASGADPSQLVYRVPAANNRPPAGVGRTPPTPAAPYAAPAQPVAATGAPYWSGATPADPSLPVAVASSPMVFSGTGFGHAVPYLVAGAAGAAGLAWLLQRSKGVPRGQMG